VLRNGTASASAAAPVTTGRSCGAAGGGPSFPCASRRWWEMKVMSKINAKLGLSRCVCGSAGLAPRARAQVCSSGREWMERYAEGNAGSPPSRFSGSRSTARGTKPQPRSRRQSTHHAQRRGVDDISPSRFFAGRDLFRTWPLFLPCQPRRAMPAIGGRPS
jgi:hypothetical protein